MDPNLVKIKEANQQDIKRGRMGTAIAHATSYLSYILHEDWYRMERELSEFKSSLLEVK